MINVQVISMGGEGKKDKKFKYRLERAMKGKLICN